MCILAMPTMYVLAVSTMCTWLKLMVLWSSLSVSKLANELGQGPMFLFHQQVPLIELTLNLPETLEAAPTLGSYRVSLQQG